MALTFTASGRKVFAASQSPVGTVLATMFPYDDPDHPLTPDESLVHAGKVTLGLPADER